MEVFMINQLYDIKVDDISEGIRNGGFGSTDDNHIPHID